MEEADRNKGIPHLDSLMRETLKGINERPEESLLRRIPAGQKRRMHIKSVKGKLHSE